MCLHNIQYTIYLEEIRQFLRVLCKILCMFGDGGMSDLLITPPLLYWSAVITCYVTPQSVINHLISPSLYYLIPLFLHAMNRGGGGEVLVRIEEEFTLDWKQAFLIYLVSGREGIWKEGELH